MQGRHPKPPAVRAAAVGARGVPPHRHSRGPAAQDRRPAGRVAPDCRQVLSSPAPSPQGPRPFHGTFILTSNFLISVVLLKS